MKGRNTNSVVRAVAESLNCTYGEANYLVDLIFNVMKKRLKKEERIFLRGFGQLRPFLQPAHDKPGMAKGQVPSGKWFHMPAQREVWFKPAPPMKRMVNEDYRGLDTLEEIYATNESKPAKPEV